MKNTLSPSSLFRRVWSLIILAASLAAIAVPAQAWQTLFSTSGTIYSWEDHDDDGNVTGTSYSSDYYTGIVVPGPGMVRTYTTGWTNTWGSMSNGSLNYEGWDGGPNDNFLFSFPVTAGGTWDLSVYGQDNSAGDYSVYVEFAPLPSTPTASAATSVTISGFTANWSASTNATGYLIDVSTSNTFSSFVGVYRDRFVSGGSTVSLAVTGLAPNTTYNYRVRATGDGGTTVSTSVISLTTVYSPPATPVPNAPSSVTTTGFTLSWPGVTGATGYRVDVSTSSTFASGFILNDFDLGTSTSKSITTATAGTTYYYRVRSVGPGGVSASSSAGQIATLPLTPPLGGTGVVTGFGFTPSWTAVTGATGYRLDLSKSSTFSSYDGGFQDLNVGSGVSYSFSNLAPSTTYYYRLRAVNISGASASSSAVQVDTTLPFWQRLLDATGNVETGDTYDENGEVNGRWGSSDDHYFTVPGPGRLKVYTTGSANPDGDVTGPAPGQSWYDNDSGDNGNLLIQVTVASGGTFNARVGAGDDQAGGSYRVVAEFLPASSLVVTTVQNANVSSLSGHAGDSTTLTAVAPPGLAVFTGWSVVSGDTYIYSPSATTTQITTGYSSGTVRAVFIADTVAPSMPGSLTAAAVTPIGCTLSWTASTDNIGVTGYEIAHQGGLITTVSSTSVSLSGLFPGTTYNLTVRARDAMGNLSIAATVSVTTSGGASANAAYSTLGTSTITLNWDPIVDTRAVAAYRIYRTPQGGGSTVSFTTNTPLFVDRGLTAGTTYNYSITMVDAANGESSPIATLSAASGSSTSGDADSDGIPDAIDALMGTHSGSPATIDTANQLQTAVHRPLP